MPCKLAKYSYKLYFSFGWLLWLATPASATLTVTSSYGGQTPPGSTTTYYSLPSFLPAGTATVGAFLDTADPFGFRSIDLTKTQTAESGSLPNMLRFTITSNVNVSTTSTSLVVITISPYSSPGVVASGVLSPIAAVNGTLCNSGNLSNTCFPTSYTSATYRYAVAFSNGMQIGIYPEDICADYSAHAAGVPVGCTAGSPNTVTAVSGGAGPIPLQISLTTLSGPNAAPATASPGPSPTPSPTPGVSPTPTGGVLDGPVAMNLNFQNGFSGMVNCSPGSLNSDYYPGDGLITILDASPFILAAPVGAAVAVAPAQSIFAIANLSPTAETYAPNFRSQNMVSQGPFLSGGPPFNISGFTNTSNGADNRYRVGFMVRDAAGIMAYNNSCELSKVQTSTIQGFLNKSRCFIATAAFRSGEAEPVLLLREFRDQILLHHELGRIFVSHYYRYSPAAAEWLVDHPFFRSPVLFFLAPLEILAWVCLHSWAVVLALSGVICLIGLLIFERRKFYSRERMLLE